MVPKNDVKSRHGKPEVKKPAQTALTRYTTKAHYELMEPVDRYPTTRYSWVEAQLMTGRKHQLRRHFKHIAHPIIGDSRYGKTTHNQFLKGNGAIRGCYCMVAKWRLHIRLLSSR